MTAAARSYLDKGDMANLLQIGVRESCLESSSYENRKCFLKNMYASRLCPERTMWPRFSKKSYVLCEQSTLGVPYRGRHQGLASSTCTVLTSLKRRQVVALGTISNEVYVEETSAEYVAGRIEEGKGTHAKRTWRDMKEYYDNNGKLMIKNLTLPQLVEWCAEIEGVVLDQGGRSQAEKRARQLWRWMYSDKCWLRNIDDAAASTVQNGFSNSFRDKFNSVATMDGGIVLEEQHTASDGTRKLVFKVSSGPAQGGKIETVLIPIVREQGSKERITLCVSSQVGCAMGCKFCFTGKMGLLGSLTTSQIVEQVVVSRRLLFEEYLEAGQSQRLGSYSTPITNVVYMGMGEPLDNLNAVIPSILTLTDHQGLHFSHNKITVSTVGLVPEMKTLLQHSPAALAVSLHGATDEVRGAIVPVNHRYPLRDLVGLLKEYFPDKKGGNHVLIEYTMMDGVNDRESDAVALLALLEGVRCKINLIVFNSHEGTKYRESSQKSVDAFRDILIRGGRVVTVRASRGDSTMAACGQLGEGKDARKNKGIRAQDNLESAV